MQRFFFLPLIAAGLVSCSSSSSDSASPVESGAQVTEIDKSGKNNPFAFKQEDVEKGDDGTITGGKRSQFDSRMQSAYAKANGSSPNYLQKDYNKKAWSGGKDYGTGSYQTSDYGQSGKKSWFGKRKSNETNQVAQAAGQDFSTGSYRAGSANESGQTARTGRSGYVESRTGDGWGRVPVILSEDEYRSISVNQAKSLLGR